MNRHSEELAELWNSRRAIQEELSTLYPPVDYDALARYNKLKDDLRVIDWHIAELT